MRIGIVAAPVERIPPKMYGGTERVISALAEELVHRGHDVTLFASADSKTSAHLVSVFPTSLREAFPSKDDISKRIQTTLLHLGNAYSMQDQFDIIHDHTSYFGLSYAQASRVPVVSTIHGCLVEDVIPLYEHFSKPYLVSISRAQRKPAPQLNFTANIYNGLPMKHYPFSKKNKGYLLAVGRLCPEKGIHNAIMLAKKLDLPLIIAAKLDEEYRDYFLLEIKPHLNKKIQWVGEVTERQRNELMSGAMAFLHLLEWEEPFGLTIIESLACGTPVIAFDKGSMSEIIIDGVTGFLAKDLNDAAIYVQKLSEINRQFCRDYALSNFSSKKMAQEYELVYEAILRSTNPVYSFLHPQLMKEQR